LINWELEYTPRIFKPSVRVGAHRASRFNASATDCIFGTRRATLARLPQQLGLTETQVIHYALSQLASNILPAYAPDNGPLNVNELKTIAKVAGGRIGKSMRSSLI